MQKEFSTQNNDQQSWLDCIGQLIYKKYYYSNDQVQEKDDPVFLQKSPFSQNTFFDKQTPNTETQVFQIQQNQQQQTLKRSRPDCQRTNCQEAQQQNNQKQIIQNKQNQMNEQESSSKEESRQNSKSIKYGNQKQYSKNYRQKKKQQLRILQEENNYLKQKINQLQQRLRQKQLEINRLKHPPIQKQVSVQQLNQQFIKKTNLWLYNNANDPSAYSKTIFTPEDQFYTQFMNSYDQHGFGGTRKQNVLNYYLNQLLQSVLRDSQKYLFLICNQTNNYQLITGHQTYSQIDSVFQQIMEFDQDKRNRIEHFSKNLHSYMLQLKNIFCDIYKDFNKILAFLQKVHNFMKSSYPFNIDFARKRIQLQNWFQKNKHTKLVRRLKSEWLDYIKKEAQNSEQVKNLKGKKKKKVGQVQLNN